MRRVLSIVLCLMLCFNLAAPAFATGNNTATTTCTLSTDVLNPGDEVTVTVTLSDCVPVKSIGLTPVYDHEVFEVVEGSWAEMGALLANFDIASGNAAAAFGTAKDINGDIFTFVLRVKEGAAAAGSEISTTAIIKDADNQDVGCTAVVTAVPGEVVPPSEEPGTEPPTEIPTEEPTTAPEPVPGDGAIVTTVTDVAQAQAGDTVVVTVELSGCALIKSAGLTPVYDHDVFELVSGEWTVEGAVLANFDMATGNAALAFLNPTDINGIIFTFELNVLESAQPGSTSIQTNAILKGDQGQDLVSVSVPAEVAVVEEACTHEELVEEPSKSPDCVNPGNHQYFTCSSCGMLFAADGVTQTTLEEVTIPALGHTPGEEWVTSPAQHWHICTVCQQPADEAGHTLEGDTCTACGYTVEATAVTCTVSAESLEAGSEITVTATLSGCVPVKSMGLTPVYDAALFELISGQWLVEDAVLANFDLEHGNAALAFAEATDINGVIFEFVLRVKDGAEAAEGTEVSATAIITDAESAQVESISVPATVIINPHVHTPAEEWTCDAESHWHVCTSCQQAVDQAEHTFNVESATIETAKFCTVCEYEAEPIITTIVSTAVSDDTLEHGQEVTVTMTLSGSVPVKSMGLTPVYDAALFELVSGQWLVEGAVLANFDMEHGNAALAFAEATDINGVIFEFVLRVKADAGETSTDISATAIITDADSAEVRSASTAATVRIAALGHSLTKTDAVAATCTEAGNIDYWTCSTCNKIFSDEAATAEINIEDTVIAALGHSLTKTDAVAATCTEAGNIDYWTCATCGKIYSDEAATTEITIEDTVIAALGHSLTKTDAVAATCTEAGNIDYWTCATCGKIYSDEAATTEITIEETVVAATGHTPDTEAWTTSETHHWHACTVCQAHLDEGEHTIEDEVCTVCGYQIVHVHSLVKTDASAPTCTEAGNDDYWTCEICGKLYSDEAGTAETTIEDVTIPALGHSLTKTDAVAATCTEAGNIDYWTCDTCGKIYSDEAATTEITIDETVVAALGHSLTKTDAVAATCTAAGNIDYWTCATCGKIYSDEAATTEITIEETVVAATGHTPAEEWTTSEDQHWHICTVCQESVDPTDHTMEDGVCTACGYQAPVVSTVIGCVIGAVTLEPGQEFTVTVTLSGCVPVKAMGLTPIYDSNLFELVSGQWLVEGAVLANFDMERGNAALAFAQATDINGEIFEFVLRVKEGADLTGAQISANGIITDGNNEEVPSASTPAEIPSEPCTHSLIKTDAVAATCETAGNIEYWTCESCGKIFSDEAGTTEITIEETVVAATGHTPAEEWATSETHHWHACTVCQAHLEEAEHTMEGDVCTVCGYGAVQVAYGDPNGDGNINSKDAALILQFAAGLPLSVEFNEVNADVNGDGRVNSKDAALILQFAAGIITQFPIQAQ